ncbi:MAG: HEAT repeat domain-containing protein [Acidobacteriaceae bacterium]|nr:HEAT repeat domain-containing protein [Acidobacteriaceae bacterium]MBV8569983.1 HEAT repeat domain-containing protein [Acidobacteriaceae bacterium]
MSSAAAASPPPRAIRSARSLVEALRAPDAFERVEVLRAIQKEPRVALSFGIFEGQDVIDALIRESHRGAGTSEWMQWLGTLDCFEDRRVKDFFLRLLCESDEPIVLFAAARYLARMAPASVPQEIYDLLLTDENPMRARAAALVLGAAEASQADGKTVCPTGGTIRLALLSGGKVPAPAIDAHTSAAWLDELNGAFQLEAMSALETQGEHAWIRLALLWDELGGRLRMWLLQWGFREFPAMLPGLLAQALRSGDPTLVLEGLRTMADAGEKIVPESIRGLAAAFLRDPDPAVRQAAAAAAPPGVNWREFLVLESDGAVRLAAMVQLARTERERAIPDLIDVLRSGDWQVRSTAASCLITLGTAAGDAVKPLVRDPDPDVRTAAVRTLLALQQDAWLEQELLI